jgi:hypothetical protein
MRFTLQFQGQTAVNVALTGAILASRVRATLNLGGSY